MFLVRMLVHLWLFGAVIDAAARSADLTAQPVKVAIAALAWPVKRPLDVFRALWSAVRGV